MQTDSANKIAPAMGVFFAVAFVVAMVTGGDQPDANATGESVISFYSDAGDFIAGIIALGLGAIAFLFFAGGVRRRLENSTEGWLAAVFFAGAVAYAVNLGVFIAATVALIDAADVANPVVAQALNILNTDNFPLSVIALATMFFAVAINVLRTASMPKWIGVVSLVAGIVVLAGPGGIVVFLAFPIWVLAVSYVLTRDSQNTAVPSPRQTTDA